MHTNISVLAEIFTCLSDLFISNFTTSLIERCLQKSYNNPNLSMITVKDSLHIENIAIRLLSN